MSNRRGAVSTVLRKAAFLQLTTKVSPNVISVGEHPRMDGALLESGGLTEEAREACLETVLLLGRVLAVEYRSPEPTEVNDALQAPLSLYWGEALPAVSKFAATTSVAAAHVTKALQTVADSIAP